MSDLEISLLIGLSVSFILNLVCFIRWWMRDTILKAGYYIEGSWAYKQNSPYWREYSLWETYQRARLECKLKKLKIKATPEDFEKKPAKDAPYYVTGSLYDA